MMLSSITACLVYIAFSTDSKAMTHGKVISFETFDSFKCWNVLGLISYHNL